MGDGNLETDIEVNINEFPKWLPPIESQDYKYGPKKLGTIQNPL